MKINRNLLGCSLIAAIVFSLTSYPSLGTSSSAAPAQGQTAQPEKPPMIAPLVQDQTRDGELSKHFRKFDLIRMDPAAAVAQIRNRGRLLLKSSERDFDIQMTPHDMRSADYSAQMIDAQGVSHPLRKTEVNTYKGVVKGLLNAQVRVSLTDKGFEGAIISRERRLFIQPARAFSKEARADDFVIYDGADLTKHEGSCGLELAEEVAAQADSTKANATDSVIDFEVSEPNQPLTTMKLARIATDADGEYVAAFGGASQANTQIQNILNFVDGIYQVEIGVTFQIVQQNTWADTATDPYTTANPNDLLKEFRDHWNNNFASGGPNAPVRNLAHLFTGKDLEGSTIGIASFGVVCRVPNFAYGLSQRFPIASTGITAQTVVLTAHEIGHNFAASHTNQETDMIPGDLERPCELTIMEATVGSGSSFCPFSRSQITGHAFGHSSCLTDLASTPPASQDCTSTSLDASGLTAAGNLTSGDCRSPSRGVEHFADRYTFNGVTGQRVAISVVRTGGNIDPYVYLIAPDGYVLSQNDDISDMDINSRIPTGFDTITLPQTGVYTVEVSSFDRLQTGTYTITVQSPGCTLTASASVQHFGTVGGNGTITITVAGPCTPNFQLDVTPESASWLVPTTPMGSGNVNINFSVAGNPGSAGRRAFILVGTAPDGSGGIRIPITQSGSAPDCTSTPISFGQTLNGSLGSPDCHSPVRGDGFFADRYFFSANAGQKISVHTVAPVGMPDTFLTLFGPNGVVLFTDDDSGGQTNSRIPGGDKFLTLGLTGTYTIEVTGFSAADVGAYTVTLTTEAPPANSIQFSQASHSVNEDIGSLSVTVNRSGNTSGAATVDYQTNDTSGSNQCNINTGAASSRCDYLRTLGTLRFAAGETSKTIAIPIIDDVYTEGAETFTITLSNVNGATLGTSTATVTINSNDASPGTNPIGNASFFVRQHYVDFLNREPDPGGLNFWVNEITSCGSDAPCIEVKRINVSAAFFLSIEFQETGYLVYRTYKSAFGNLSGAPVPVVLNDFLRGTQEIGQGVQVNVGNWQVQLEGNKQTFMLAFVQRADFLAAFPNSMTATDFVTQLNTRAGGVLSASEQTTLINMLGVTPFDVTRRADVLRAVAEDSDLRTAEFNKAFVLMQYFGYLRRNPNEFPDSNFDGLNFWLGKLNQFNGDFIGAEMVKAFITSIEYRQRFGP